MDTISLHTIIFSVCLFTIVPLLIAKTDQYCNRKIADQKDTNMKEKTEILQLIRKTNKTLFNLRKKTGKVTHNIRSYKLITELPYVYSGQFSPAFSLTMFTTGILLLVNTKYGDASLSFQYIKQIMDTWTLSTCLLICGFVCFLVSWKFAYYMYKLKLRYIFRRDTLKLTELSIKLAEKGYVNARVIESKLITAKTSHKNATTLYFLNGILIFIFLYCVPALFITRSIP